MRKTRISTVVFLISLIFAALCNAQIIDRVIAVINDEIIIQSELDRILNPIYKQYREIYSEKELGGKIDDARRELLIQMIEDKLILQEARKKGIVVLEEEIDRRLNEVKSKFTDETEFADVLESQSLSIKILREKYKEQIMMKKIFDKEVRAKIVILPTQIQEYYKQHQNDFNEPETVVLRTLLLKIASAEDRQKIFDWALEIRKKLEAGENFEELAKKFSEDASAIEGGLIGYVKKGQLREELDKQVFSLKAGEISDVIETSLGFHIFKVDEKISAYSRSMEEVREEVENILFQEKVNERFEEWMDVLKKDAYISIK